MRRSEAMAAPAPVALRAGKRYAKRSPHGQDHRLSALRLGFCLADLGRHDGGAACAAFWLQLESPSSAAVTVDILALQTRGRDLPKGRLPGPRHHHHPGRWWRDTA